MKRNRVGRFFSNATTFSLLSWWTYKMFKFWLRNIYSTHAFTQFSFYDFIGNACAFFTVATKAKKILFLAAFDMNDSFSHNKRKSLLQLEKIFLIRITVNHHYYYNFIKTYKKNSKLNYGICSCLYLNLCARRYDYDSLIFPLNISQLKKFFGIPSK